MNSFAVFPDADCLMAVHLFRARDSFQDPGSVIGLFGGNNDRERFSDHLTGTVAVDLLRALVPRKHRPIDRSADDAVDGRLRDGGEQ